MKITEYVNSHNYYCERRYFRAAKFSRIVLNRLVQFNVIRHYVETNLFPYYS